MKKQSVGISDDYAVLETGIYTFYYGYEEEVNDEWAFVAKKGKNEVARYSKSFIENNSDIKNRSDEPDYYLLAGIGLFLNKLEQ